MELKTGTLKKLLGSTYGCESTYSRTVTKTAEATISQPYITCQPLC